MKQCPLAVFIVAVLSPVLCSVPIAAQDEQTMPVAVESLPAAARFWLAEDVLDIITPEERRAFLSLKTDEDRDNFIDLFWARRNPDPDSSRNAFEEEHYKRIVFANEKYGTARSKVLGRQTDREESTSFSARRIPLNPIRPARKHVPQLARVPGRRHILGNCGATSTSRM